MKIKIDKNGYLWLERAGKMKAVKCPEDHYTEKEPYSSVSIHKHWSCGDWCSLFREEISTIYEVGMVTTKKAVQISLCKNYHTCFIEDFTDERGEE